MIKAADIGKLAKAIHPGSYDHVDDEELGKAGIDKHGGDTRKLAKQLLDGMTVYSLPHFMKVWNSTPISVKNDVFEQPHVKEIDLLLKTMKGAKTDHLRDDEIGRHVADFMEGTDGLHPIAARILFTPSGARLMTRALTLDPKSEAFRSTLGILQGRFASEAKKV